MNYGRSPGRVRGGDGKPRITVRLLHFKSAPTGGEVSVAKSSQEYLDEHEIITIKVEHGQYSTHHITSPVVKRRRSAIEDPRRAMNASLDIRDIHSQEF